MARLSCKAIGMASALALAPFSVSAQETARPMTEAEFQSAVEGQVFDVIESGVLRQREEFFSDGRVRLGFVPEGQPAESRAPIPCIDGEWYMQGDAVCFGYVRPDGEADGPHCWTIYDLGEGRQRAESTTMGSALVLDLQRTDTPLICRGPEIGV